MMHSGNLYQRHPLVPRTLDGDGGATILSSLTGDLNSWTINTDYQNIIEQSNSNNIPGRVVMSSCQSAPEVLYAAIGSGYIIIS